MRYLYSFIVVVSIATSLVGMDGEEKKRPERVKTFWGLLEKENELTEKEIKNLQKQCFVWKHVTLQAVIKGGLALTLEILDDSTISEIKEKHGEEMIGTLKEDYCLKIPEAEQIVLGLGQITDQKKHEERKKIVVDVWQLNRKDFGDELMEALKQGRYKNLGSNKSSQGCFLQ